MVNVAANPLLLLLRLQLVGFYDFKDCFVHVHNLGLNMETVVGKTLDVAEV